MERSGPGKGGERWVGGKFTSIEESPDRVTGAQGAQGGQVDDLGDGVRVGQVEDLRVQKVVAVEHEFGEEPVGRAVEGGVGQVTADVGLDGEREEVVGLRVLVEVGVAGRGEAARLEPVAGLVRVAGEEQSAGLVQIVEGCSGDVGDGDVV